MPKYRILPVEPDEIIEAEDAGDALINFATAMDSDMGKYFRAVAVPERKSTVLIKDLPEHIMSAVLRDSWLPGGGTSHQGETLRDFVLDAGMAEDDRIDELHNNLLLAGIVSPLGEYLSESREELPEETRMITISTAHVTLGTLEAMHMIADGNDADDRGDHLFPPVYAKADYGFWVYTQSGYDAEIYDDLSSCEEYARRHGAEWLCLDSDGPIVVDLPVYER